MTDSDRQYDNITQSLTSADPYLVKLLDKDDSDEDMLSIETRRVLRERRKGNGFALLMIIDADRQESANLRADISRGPL